jgi:hypothetical protein
MDDLACVAVLTTLVLTILLAAATVAGNVAWHGVPVAQECPRSPSTHLPSSMHLVPPSPPRNA